MDNPIYKAKVLNIVKDIEEGQVMTYGDVGNMTGINPRLVGWILSGLTEEEQQTYPWQRVVAKGGLISSLKLGARGLLQVELLKKEGFKIEDGRILNLPGNLFG